MRLRTAIREVVHRDIKFENIMFENNEPDSEVKLIDFGLSKTYSAEEDDAGR